MISGATSAKYQMIYDMSEQPDNCMSIREMCQLAGVSKSGYYEWRANEELRSQKEREDWLDFIKIRKAYEYRGYPKGARGIYMLLLKNNPPVVMNIKKIRRLMQKYKLECPVRKANPYKRMVKSMQTNNIAENLLMRGFKEHGPRQVLLTDITYIPFKGEFCYLSTVLDAYTKQVLAYALSESLAVDFVLETIHKLVEKHGVSLSKTTMIHSDRGVHYTSYKFIQIVEDAELRRSMSRKGNCWDNAPQESFFGHMKDEISLKECKNFKDVKDKIDDWMDYYNNERYQWRLNKMAPNEYYEWITRKTIE